MQLSRVERSTIAQTRQPLRVDTASPADGNTAATAKLRLLATTDLHMHLTAHNYVTDQLGGNHGLAGIATLIDQARAEAAMTGSGVLLLDNGDLLQGTAMGDWLARQDVTPAHPAIACLHALGYDAMGVGNHDLDYGVPYLKAVAAALRLPMIATNMSAADLAPLQAAVLIPCDVRASADGPAHLLQIGVLSVLPDQTALWNHQQLEGEATVSPAAEALRAAIPKLRAQGADIIIVLAHMGLGAGSGDTALPLARIPGIDAMVTGHTHRRFPDHTQAFKEGLNNCASTVENVPTIMPGHAASDLAVLDLELTRSADAGWKVTSHHGALRPNGQNVPAAAAVQAATADSHTALRAYLSAPVGQTSDDLHNYFALAAPTSICALTAMAMAQTVQGALLGRPEAKLPLLAATAAHTAGGRDGPENYLRIPRGPVLRRHIAGLDPYANKVWATLLTGRDLKLRLEHAARVFTRLSPDAPAQPLRDPDVPIFSFDTYFGITYDIDPTQPPGQRITSLHYEGTPIEQNQEFVLATNPFRAVGGGGYPATSPDQIILRCDTSLTTALINAVSHPGSVAPTETPWKFAPAEPVSATLNTAPEAHRYLSDIAHLSPLQLADTPDGFATFRLTF